MLTIDPKELSIAQLFGHLTGAVGPRPIAFASTVDADGHINLAPFSFFNVSDPSGSVIATGAISKSGTTDCLLNFTRSGDYCVNIIDGEDILKQAIELY